MFFSFFHEKNVFSVIFDPGINKNRGDSLTDRLPLMDAI